MGLAANSYVIASVCSGSCLRRWLAASTLFFTIFVTGQAVHAGPPFRTDDPEPVEYKHWEFYTATQYQNDRDGVSGTAPHLEANYGVAPDVQLHIIAPDAYDRPRGGPTLAGLGDVELGVKYRFIQEGDYVPMVGTFPFLEVPTASKTRGLGTGQFQFFLPLWFQKSWGPWTSYGGGGYWINPGTGNKNYWYAGWLLQRDITKWLTVGAEVFHLTPSTADGEHETGYNIGAILNFTENHHLICSAGTDIHGPASFFFYAAYLWTWGPPEKKK
ncbi:MAG: hypothetical protein ABSC55_14440 [Syntrophorhabdales bacterium]|jgi:hypothetical protein